MGTNYNSKSAEYIHFNGFQPKLTSMLGNSFVLRHTQLFNKIQTRAFLKILQARQREQMYHPYRVIFIIHERNYMSPKKATKKSEDYYDEQAQCTYSLTRAINSNPKYDRWELFLNF